MARFTVRLPTPLPAEEAWRRVWNLDAHTRVIPFTRLTGDGTGGRPLGAGSRFVARTALGPLGMDDVMAVRRFDPPTGGTGGHASVEKEGRVIGGRIEADIRPSVGSSPGTATGSEVLWEQDITIRGLPSALDPIVAAGAKAAYTATLRRLLSLG